MKKMKNVKTETPEVSEQPKMRTVMLAAPSYDGKVNVWHASALSETCKIGLTRNINVIAVYMSFDALVQRARNDIVKMAIDSNVDDLFFIDCDMDWNPNDFFRMLEYDVGIVGAPVVKKSDFEQYNVKLTSQLKIEDNGLSIVDAVGTGMMRIRRDALLKLWEASPEYKEPHKPEPTRMVFDIQVIDGQLVSEDIVMCRKWVDMGEKIYIDPVVSCGHSGEKRWIGNFYEWYKVNIRR
jgi:hypothetical protein